MTKEQCQAYFTIAGFEILRIWELTNQYWPEVSPWWLVKTAFGLIEIGERKCVIIIDWIDTKYRGFITEDNVTMDSGMVHAWSEEKMVEYLRTLREKLS